jgi:tetratricopeptide (TPR) repeat protein
LSTREALLAICAAAACLALPARGVAAERADHFRLVPLTIEGCPGIARTLSEREVFRVGERTVDAGARFWTLDRARDYTSGAATTRYVVGTGELQVNARLADDLTQESVDLVVSRPIESSHLAIYLPGVALPCRRTIRYAVEALEPAAVDLATLARFDEALHRATELLYDQQFAPAEALLREARTLRPTDPAPYWMLARLRYLSLEADPATHEAKLEGYREAERFADLAVQHEPNRAEGYLWQGIARGRIATTIGSARTALGSALGERGPRWLEETFHRAVTRPPEFRFFGFSTRADALHALAQYYRLAPDGWYMQLLGTRGDISRAIELSTEAVEAQPVRIEYRAELAVELLCRNAPGDREAALAELRALLEIPAITPIDRIDHEHARALLRAVPDDVCSYSRDSAQEAVR